MLNAVFCLPGAAKHAFVSDAEPLLKAAVCAPTVGNCSEDTSTNARREKHFQLIQVSVASMGGGAEGSRNAPASLPFILGLTFTPPADIFPDPLYRLRSISNGDDFSHMFLKELTLFLHYFCVPRARHASNIQTNLFDCDVVLGSEGV